MLLKKEEVIRVFQNINEAENAKEKLDNKKSILTNVISKKYIILYIITFMVSCVSMNYDISPFSLSIVTAAISNEIPVVAILVLALVGNIVGIGVTSVLNYVVTLLMFLASFLIYRPKYNDLGRNEKIKLAKRIFISSLIVNVIKMCVNEFLLYDLLISIAMSIVTVIFYKIFTNALSLIINYDKKMAFSIEEVLGTSLLLTIALCSLGDFCILGFSVRNILSIFIVLVLGWKNGILVGTTAGATVGVTLGIIANNEPSVVAAYTLSGMIAGILNKFGRIGVVCGFVLGNIILTYVANGLVHNLIIFKEILIAGIGLLVIPKNITFDINNIFKENKFLPVGNGKGLNKSKETINKLNNVSKAVKDMADTLKNVASTVVDEKDIKEKNKQTFISELLNNLDNIKENILYDCISNVDGKIVNDIFEKLIENQYIKDKDLIKILAQNNNYVIGFDEEELRINRDIEKMTNIINSAYRISKMNFIWSIRLKEEKQNFENQLNGVSEAISNIAEEMNIELNEEDLYNGQKEQIVLLLKQKDIIIHDISINKKENDRFKIDLYIEKNEKEDFENIVLNIVCKILNEKLIILEENDLKKQNIIQLKIISDDKYIIDIGHSIALKDGMPVSGDSIVQTKLKDGKYLIAISDGMGSRSTG